MRPELGRAYQERGHCFRQQGERALAIGAYRRAVELNPVLTSPWKMLAQLCAGFDEAIYREAIDTLGEIERQDPELLAAIAAYHDQSFALAEEKVRAFLLRRPSDPAAMRLLANLGTRLGEYEDAEFILAQCKILNPDFFPARQDYVELLGKRFNYEAALKEAEDLCALRPDSEAFQTILANQLLMVGETEAALEKFDELHDREPQVPHFSLSRGHALKTLGRTEEAVAAYRDAYRARPDFGDAYWSLANLKTFRFDDTEIAAMIAAEANRATETEDRIHLCFALGKAFEDAKDPARSFEFYHRGNAQRQAVLKYNPQIVTKEIEGQIRNCDASLFASKAGSGCDAADPIFILGLPRAGSTLLEQILASHSQVEGTSELPVSWRLPRASRRATRPTMRNAIPRAWSIFLVPASPNLVRHI